MASLNLGHVLLAAGEQTDLERAAKALPTDWAITMAANEPASQIDVTVVGSCPAGRQGGLLFSKTFSTADVCCIPEYLEEICVWFADPVRH